MTPPIANLALGVAGPGSDHAFLAAELVAFAGGFVERTRNPGLDRIAVGTARVLQIDRERGTGASHGQRGTRALALLESCGARHVRSTIIIGLAIGAALADREGAHRLGRRGHG